MGWPPRPRARCSAWTAWSTWARRTFYWNRSLVLVEQVSHRLCARVAGMVQAGQAEASLNRAQQREVRIKLSTLKFVEAVVGIHDRHDVVNDGLNCIVVLIPNHHNRAPSPMPNRGLVDGRDDFLHCLISQDD